MRIRIIYYMFPGILSIERVTRGDAERKEHAMQWMTPARAQVDRLACPWLISRLIDPQPEFLSAPADQGLAEAATQGAIPYDIPGKERTTMPARIATRHHSTPDTAADSPLYRVARHACRGGDVAAAQPPPPLRRLQRLASWLGILVCACPACRLPRGKPPDTGWQYLDYFGL